MRSWTYALSVAAACLIGTAAQAAPEPVELEPLDHTRASVAVVWEDGSERVYTPADLEQLPTYHMTTQTPWRSEEARFEGVLLADLLEANGLGDVEAILVTAENDFTSVIPREVWMQHDVMLATRVDGQPHSRRARGPIQFVIDMEAYENSPVAREGHLVWMAARIEAVR